MSYALVATIVSIDEPGGKILRQLPDREAMILRRDLDAAGRDDSERCANQREPLQAKIPEDGEKGPDMRDLR